MPLFSPEQKIKELKLSVSQIKRAMSEILTRISHLGLDIGSQEDRLKKLEIDSDFLKSDLETINDNIADLKSQIARMQFDIDNLKDEHR